MSKELTEQFRKKDLDFGFYYVLFPNEKPQIYSSEYLRFDFKDSEKIEILAPVPDYTEWKQTEKQVQNLQRMVEQECSKRCELEQQLKEANDALKQIADTRYFQYGHKFAQSYIKKWGVE